MKWIIVAALGLSLTVLGPTAVLAQSPVVYDDASGTNGDCTVSGPADEHLIYCKSLHPGRGTSDHGLAWRLAPVAKDTPPEAAPDAAPDEETSPDTTTDTTWPPRTIKMRTMRLTIKSRDLVSIPRIPTRTAMALPIATNPTSTAPIRSIRTPMGRRQRRQRVFGIHTDPHVATTPAPRTRGTLPPDHDRWFAEPVIGTMASEETAVLPGPHDARTSYAGP